MSNLQQQIEVLRQRIESTNSGISLNAQQNNNATNSASNGHTTLNGHSMNSANGEKNEKSTISQVDKEVGVIVPPPELRVFIDKTAKYVATHGVAFQEKILKAKGDDPKFYFLRSENPFHAFFQIRVKNFAAQEEEILRKEADNEQQAATPSSQQEQTSNHANDHAPISVTSTGDQDQRVVSVIQKKTNVLASKSKEKPITDPLPYFFGVTIPRGMTALDLDIMKLTAQYAARNEVNFIHAIAGREARNQQFDFLKPHHRFHGFFLKLVQIYKAIISPSEAILEQLKFFANRENKIRVLNKIYDKAEWETMEMEKKRKQEMDDQAEFEAMQSIDWYDFVVVETIDFDINEDVDAEQVADIPLGDATYPVIAASTDQEMNIDEDMEVEQPQQPSVISADSSTLSTLHPSPITVESAATSTASSVQQQNENNMATDDGDVEEEIKKRLKKNYKRTQKTPSTKQEDYVKDPISGNLVPLSKISEHMKIQLIDPRWKEQKIKERQKFETTNIAPNEEFTNTLFEFAKKRTDIFGKEEVGIGRAVGEKGQESSKHDDRLIWDGHTASIPLATSAAISESFKKNQPPAPVPEKQLQQQQQQQSAPLLPTPGPPPSQPLLFQSHPQMPHMDMYRMNPMQPMNPMPVIPPMTQPVPSALPIPSNVTPANRVDEEELTPPPPPPPPEDEDYDEEPSAKKQRTSGQYAKSEQNLIPEEEWLRNAENQKVLIKLVTPKIEGKESWGLTGQEITLENVDLTTTVNELKEIVFKKCNMPSNKQRFRIEGIGFLKDTQSLAYYNLSDHHEVHLAVKERSKKKK